MGCSECGSALWTIPRGRAQRSIFGSGAGSRGSRYPNAIKYSKRNLPKVSFRLTSDRLEVAFLSSVAPHLGKSPFTRPSYSNSTGKLTAVDPKQSFQGPTALKRTRSFRPRKKVPDGSCSGVIEKIFPSAATWSGAVAVGARVPLSAAGLGDPGRRPSVKTCSAAPAPRGRGRNGLMIQIARTVITGVPHLRSARKRDR